MWQWTFIVVAMVLIPVAGEYYVPDQSVAHFLPIDYTFGPSCPMITGTVRECRHPIPVKITVHNTYDDPIAIYLEHDPGVRENQFQIVRDVPAQSATNINMEFNLTLGDMEVRGQKLLSEGSTHLQFCGWISLSRLAKNSCRKLTWPPSKPRDSWKTEL